jgi:pimeloyl-ACP methyl ester carboxylesterase
VVRRLVPLLALAAVFAAPAGARAAVPLTPCGKTQGLECGTVVVPLDRSGATPGTVSLHVEVLPATGFARGAMFLIAGGPGQGSAQAFDLRSRNLADFMRAMLPGYTLVAFDNRGTGASGVLRCPALQTTTTTNAEQAAALAAQCAGLIGPQRQFYATRDHAEDVDAVRAALGFPRIALFGVSYGTKLALAYALAHPASVERLLLDSVLPTNFPDPFDQNVLQELPGTLERFCGGAACRAATPSFAGDVVAVANRIEAKPLRGKVVSIGGRTKTVRMNGEDLLSVVIDSDLSPGLAAELPAAVHAARGGYTRPLLRLFDFDLRTSKLSVNQLSWGLNAATNCADGRFPWSPDTAPSARRAVIDAALAALPPGALGPFGPWAARLGSAFFCEQWPEPAGNTPLGAGPLPNVPVLAVDGGFDLRTPVANALSVVDQFPQGRLIVVPGVGHSVLTADFSFCSQRAVRAWILGTLNAPTRAQCPRVPSLVKILAPFPRAAHGSIQGTLGVAGRAIREAEAMWLQVAFSPGAVTPSGLFGGKLSSRGSRITLTRYAIAPGIFVTGTLRAATRKVPFGFRGQVTVSGPSAADGRLRVSGNRLAGTLAGRRVSGRY